MTIKQMILLGVLITLGACSNQETEQVEGKPNRPECIAPAKPGGGFDLTCKLAQSSFEDFKLLSKPMRVIFMPGGLGAVAINKVVVNQPDNGDAIIAFSSGSLLNIAQGKFGQYTEKDVKWLATIGVDYGMVAVKSDSSFKTLDDLVKALKEDTKKVIFGSGAGVGGQDWMQTALLAKAAGINVKEMTYVALEGGGEANIALLGNHVHVITGGLAEVSSYLDSGEMRVLAVFAQERVTGKYNNIPTAKELGYDIEWPIVRGFYMGPKVSDAQYQWWKNSFDNMMEKQEFQRLREQRDLFEFSLTGEELNQFVLEQTAKMRDLSREFDLLE